MVEGMNLTKYIVSMYENVTMKLSYIINTCVQLIYANKNILKKKKECSMKAKRAQRNN
jgi:uncharacterized protein YgiM (DUF1202 family)